MSIVTNATNQPAAKGDTAPASRPTELSGDAFLTLLVAQFKNQDPSAPQDPTQSIAQLATLSQLTTLQDIDSTLKRIEAALTGSSSSTAQTSLVGTTPASAVLPKSA